MKRLDLTAIEIPSLGGPCATFLRGEPVRGLGVTLQIDALRRADAHLPESPTWCATHLEIGAAFAMQLTAYQAARVVAAVAPLHRWEGMSMQDWKALRQATRTRVKTAVELALFESETAQ